MESINTLIRVGFIPLYNLHFPSSRYRVFQFLEPLSKEGFQGRILEAPERNPRKRLIYLPRLIRFAVQSEVLFVQKRTFPGWILRLLASLNPKLIFDLDDAIYLQPQRQKSVKEILKTARIVVAGNANLANYACSFNPKVTVIPTVVDTNLYHPYEGIRHPEEKRLILGWIGQNPNRGDLFPLKPVFDHLAVRFPGKLVLHVISSQPLKMDTRLGVEFIPWTMEGARTALQQLDIGLMPLDDTEWNRAKCAFKIIQYLATSTPAVASPVGMNQEVVSNGVNGYLASTPQEWTDRLSGLIMDENLRQVMGQRGRRLVIERYSVEAVLPLLVEVLKASANESCYSR